MRATVRGQEDTKWSDGRNRNPSSRAGMEEAADGRAPGQQGFAPPNQAGGGGGGAAALFSPPRTRGLARREAPATVANNGT